MTSGSDDGDVGLEVSVPCDGLEVTVGSVEGDPDVVSVAVVEEPGSVDEGAPVVDDAMTGADVPGADEVGCDDDVKDDVGAGG